MLRDFNIKVHASRGPQANATNIFVIAQPEIKLFIENAIDDELEILAACKRIIQMIVVPMQLPKHRYSTLRADSNRLGPVPTYYQYGRTCHFLVAGQNTACESARTLESAGRATLVL